MAKEIKNETIKVQRGAKYLGDVYEFIPSNVLLAKGICGCGATSLEIECNRHSIIAVPYTSLIVNKVAQYPNERAQVEVLGVYGGIKVEDIESYVTKQLESNRAIKIIVTYNSIDKVVEGCRMANFNAYNDSFLMVDEYHCLRTQYAFRNDAVIKLLHHAQQFKDVSYVTATPVKREYLLKALKGIDIITLEWDNVLPVKVNKITTNSPKTKVVKLIEDVLNDRALGNYYFFVNSVAFIREIIKTLQKKGYKLTNEEVNVYCSKGETNTIRLESINIAIDENITGGKRINFLTSKCFEGVDIYDENGISVIVSDKYRKSTLLDVSTAIKQIAGRIRDAKNTAITHILSYSKDTNGISRYDLPEDAFNANVEVEMEANKIELSRASDDTIESLSTNEKAIALVKERAKTSSKRDNLYISEDVNGVLFVDEELIIQDRYIYDILNSYSTNVRIDDEYYKAQMEIQSDLNEYYKVTDNLVSKSDTGYSFRDLVEVVNNMSTKAKLDDAIMQAGERRKAIESKQPYVYLALKHLGYDTIKEMDFHSGNIARKLNTMGIFATSVDIKEVVKRRFSKTHRYENKEAKQLLQECYNEAGIKGKAQVKHLLDYFDIEQKRVKENGVNKNLVIIK